MHTSSGYSYIVLYCIFYNFTNIYKQVPPAELEAILLTHDAVKEAAVVGMPDEIAGELPVAFVVKHPDQNIAEEELIKFVART